MTVIQINLVKPIPQNCCKTLTDLSSFSKNQIKLLNLPLYLKLKINDCS